MARNYYENETVIKAFLNNYSMTDIMKDTGLSKTTCYKIRNDPKFQDVLRGRREAITNTAVNKMQECLLKDVDILQKIIEDPDTAAQTRVNAIQVLMNQFRDWVTTTDLQKRLEALQRTILNVSDKK